MFIVLLFYKYIHIEDPKQLAHDIRVAATRLSLTGRIIVAEEGINATVEGTPEQTDAFVAHITKDKRFADMHIKRSEGEGTAFPKLSVKVRDEIVATKFPKDVDPTKETGKRLSPDELHSLLTKKEDITIVDMRNDYEFGSGHFAGSVHPNLRASRDLKDNITKINQYKDKKVVTVCTGGIRCEKMSAYLIKHGFKKVYQLDGGIHSYIEKYPGKHFDGTLYTFDNRDTMHFGGKRNVVGKCIHCGAPTEEYYNCANDECDLHFLACKKCANKPHVFCSAACAKNPKRLSISKR